MNKECPGCKTPVAANTSFCSNCGWKFTNAASNNAPNISRPALRPKIPCEVQMAFTVDRTRSSQDFEKGIPITVNGIMDTVVAKARKVSVWGQTHGDLDEGQDIVLLVDGGTADEAKIAAARVVYDGGGDPPEHHLDAIERLLLTVPWISDPQKARGAIVALLTAESKPARSGRTARQIGEDIKRRGVLLYLVCEETPQLRELCDAAQGSLFRISNSPDPKDLQSIATKISASITQVASAGATVPLTASSANP